MENILQQGYVRTDLQPGGVAHIEFYHPAHNSLPGALLQSLAEAIRAAGDDPAVRCLVLRSAEHKTFCAGASFQELAAISDAETGKRFFGGFALVINALRRCPKIAVGRVHGKAVGGGVGLAAAMDYCMASRYASVRLSELAVGIGPFVIGPAVERRIGTAAFGQLALNPGEWQTAAWAREKGLFQEVFDTVEQLDAYIAHFTANLCSYHPEALSELKRALWHGTDHWDALLGERAAVSGRLVLSSFTREAIRKFNE
jgi:methylglutaconyl-CoA hydratase